MTKRAKVAPSEPADSGARFSSLLGRIITVSKEELTKREAAYQETRRATETRVKAARRDEDR